MSNDEIQELRYELLGSLLFFTRYFYKIRTGRDFVLGEPISREPHQITICREFTNVLLGSTLDLLVNCPPGSGKSELCIHFVAWALARYPDAAFIYLSYSKELAAKHTYTIKQVIELAEYRRIFGISIRRDSSAKDNFKTLQGGAVKAFGSGGAVTGQDAGLPNVDRFSGALIMDDMHKPDEVHSDAMRESVIENYNQTIKPRRRSPTVPFIYIGHCLHEDDLPSRLKAGKDGRNWKKVILPALDVVGNALNPKVNPKEMLLIEKEINPYVFASQYQQDPQPAGGAIFKEDWFMLLDEEPEFLTTFITVDSAETDKDYNDATVFEHWGVYKIEDYGVKSDITALHLIDCWEIRVEPKDLESEFNQFYMEALQHKVKPVFALIEKKSTGVTLSSVLSAKRGLQIIPIERTRASGNKTARYLEMQPFVASKRISLMSSGKLWIVKDNKNINTFINHMGKISANNSHAHDDIADAAYDAVKAAFIDDFVLRGTMSKQKDRVSAAIIKNFNHIQQLRDNAYGR